MTSPSDGNHCMSVRSARPHQVGLGGIGFGGIGQAQVFHACSNDHEMRTGHDPMIVCGLPGRSGIGVAGSLIATKHVGNAEFIRWRLVFHGGAEKGHAVGVGAHDVVDHDQAGESILAFA